MSAPLINLETLEILDAIDRRGSFAGAAEELGKVPSALSYSVQKLEEQLDVSIFTRLGRRSVLTPAGKTLLSKGRQLLIASRNLGQEVKQVATGWETRIRIGLETMQATGSIFDALHEFLIQHPSVEVEVTEEVMGGAWEALIQDRVDLVIGAKEPIPQSQGIRTLAYQKTQPVMAVSSDHPLAQFWGTISAAELSHHRQIIIRDSSETGVPRSSEIFTEKKRLYVHNMAMKIEAQRAGLGFGFVPYEMIKSDLAAGKMKVLNVEGYGLYYESFLAWKLANRGNGIKKMIELLSGEEKPTAQSSFEY